VDVAELAPGLWRWSSAQPEWTPAVEARWGWRREVGSAYWEGRDAVCLVDPLVPSDPVEAERFLRHLDDDVERLGLPVAVLMTTRWHERSSAVLAERYGGVVHSPPVGGALPGGLRAVPVGRRQEVAYLIPSGPAALVVGDVLLGDGNGGVRLCPDDWSQRPEGPRLVRAALCDALAHEFELLLVSHGDPVVAGGRAALAKALDV
jgi:hypothetical protein